MGPADATVDMRMLLQVLVDGLARGAIVGLAAAGLALTFAIARFIHAAHGDVVTLGAYLALLAYHRAGLGMAPAAAVGVVGGAVAGLALYQAVYRRLGGQRPIALLIASVGVSFVLRYGVAFAWGTGQYSYPVPVLRALRWGGLRLVPYDAMVMATAAGLVLFLWAVLKFTPVGRDMRAVADNPSLARAAGISSERVMVYTWLLAGGLAGAAGVLLGVKTVLTPYMGWDLLIPAFAASVLGGVTNPQGAVAGGLFIGVVEEVAGVFWSPTYKLAGAFGAMVLVLLVRPAGLFGRVTDPR